MNRPVTAPEGAIYLCTACGKTSRRIDGAGESNGWDVNCSLYANLVRDDESLVVDQNGIVIEAQPYDVQKENKNDE